jgi:hypothetical protein
MSGWQRWRRRRQSQVKIPKDLQFVTDFTPKLYSNDMATNCQVVNLSSADNFSQCSGGQTMLLGVPISTDVVIVLHSLRVGGIMGITPVRSNRSAQ